MAELAEFSLRAGESKTLDLSLTDEDGAPFDATGCTIVFRAAATARSTPLISKSTGDGITIAGSTVSVVFDPADTEELERQTLYFEAKLTTPAGAVDKSLAGFMQIEASAT